MIRRTKGKYTYFIVDKYPDENEAEFIGYGSGNYDTDAEAIAGLTKDTLITSDTRIAKFIALPVTTLKAVE